jgi:hypothetical protein
VLLNGAQADGGVANEMEVANGGQLYAIGYGGWSVWQSSAWVASSGPTSPPSPPTPAPPPPPSSPQPLITVMPSPPEIPDTTPLGAVVATFAVAMSDGSPFTGTVDFGPPYYDAGGIFAISGNTIVVNPSGPGVGPNMATVTDYFTLVATA